MDNVAVKEKYFTAIFFEVEMDIKDKIDFSLYLDCYAPLFNEHQKDIMRLYFDCDVSLNEIAEQYGISRQAVRDLLLRGQKSLISYEEKLGLMKKKSRIISLVDECLNYADGKTCECLTKIKNEMEEN